MGGPDVHGLVQVRNHEVGEADRSLRTNSSARTRSRLSRFGLRAPEDPARARHDCGHRSAAQGRAASGAGAGAAITSTATARRRMEAPSTESGSAASGRCSRANGPLRRLRRESAKRRRGAARDNRGADQSPWAASFPSRCGTPHPFPIGELAPGKPTELGHAPRLGARGICEAIALAQKDGRVFDMSPHTMLRRYLDNKRTGPLPPMA